MLSYQSLPPSVACNGCTSKTGKVLGNVTPLPTRNSDLPDLSLITPFRLGSDGDDENAPVVRPTRPTDEPPIPNGYSCFLPVQFHQV
ncbi:MAG: hypothetical protein ACJ746_01045 [Bryobacteraceae bacterium]